MTFAGILSAKDRANVIAYLRTLSKDPVPLPKPGEAAPAAATPAAPPPRDNDAREWRARNQCAGPIRRPGSYTAAAAPPATTTPANGAPGTNAPAQSAAPAAATPAAAAPRDNDAREWRARNQCAGPIRRPGSHTRGARGSRTE